MHPAVPPGTRATAAQLAEAADAVRSTTIVLDYSLNHASVSNLGGGRRDVSASGPVDSVVHESKFGHPAERAARVVAECRQR